MSILATVQRWQRRETNTPKQPPPRRGPRRPLGVETLEARLLLSAAMPDHGADEHMAALALVPDHDVTARAVQSGAWSSASTWQGGLVPAAGADVLIPDALTVTVDGVTNTVHTVRVDGTLQFATDRTTELRVDTLVVNEDGSLLMGTTANPVAAAVRASVTFTNTGPLDPMWDPHFLSRGLIALGDVTLTGAETTPFATLLYPARASDTTLVLSQIPTNWRVGDDLVLAGTNGQANEDEALRIRAISGNRVTVAPLAYHHTPPAGMAVYMANLTRNVTLRTVNASDTNQGNAH